MFEIIGKAEGPRRLLPRERQMYWDRGVRRRVTGSFRAHHAACVFTTIQILQTKAKYTYKVFLIIRQTATKNFIAKK